MDNVRIHRGSLCLHSRCSSQTTVACTGSLEPTCVRIYHGKPVHARLSVPRCHILLVLAVMYYSYSEYLQYVCHQYCPFCQYSQYVCHQCCPFRQYSQDVGTRFSPQILKGARSLTSICDSHLVLLVRAAPLRAGVWRYGNRGHVVVANSPCG